MTEDKYESVIADKFSDDYFTSRVGNDRKRIEQFKIDADFIKQFVSSGNLCDIGCSTGEFVRALSWSGQAYGLEVNEYAKSLAKDIISFEKNIFTEQNFFDLVIFRGTIQHVDEPFRMIKYAYRALKNGGCLIFLATPNANSPLYRLKGTLPFLHEELNFFIPGDKELMNALKNFGYEVIKVEYPYFETPYCNFVMDHLKFVKNLFTRKMTPHAFWKSSMSIAARKTK